MKIFRTVEALDWLYVYAARPLSRRSFPCLHFFQLLPPSTPHEARQNAHENRRKVAGKKAADEKLRRSSPRSLENGVEEFYGG